MRAAQLGGDVFSLPQGKFALTGSDAKSRHVMSDE